ncbi:MAG: transketolase [Spirochaetales bacterium]|nr:transketolase [Spirochaetales bacterium]
MEISSLKALAASVRSLSMDAVQAANSGHPGLPLGCADLGALLYGEVLKHDPSQPQWIDRDRFILSAGHGSMWLYSLLHLTGYGLPLDELKKFRQLGSKTPGHPEYGWTVGVETTTGPLGAGFSNAVGFAIAETKLAAEFNTSEHTVIDHYTYALAGDGCLMEGVSAEAASLAGHLELGKLIVFYDSNGITIEGHTDIAFTEDVAGRFEAYGWQVLKGSAHDIPQMMSLITEAKAEKKRPSLLILTSTIGFGSPHKAGTHDVHGTPLGAEEIKATKKNLGLPEDEQFYIVPEALRYTAQKAVPWKAARETWEKTFANWAKANPELKAKWDNFFTDPTTLVENAEEPSFAVGESIATRVAGGKSLNAFAKVMPGLTGGSADLAPSNNTALPFGEYSAQNRLGRTFHFGVREHGMGGIVNGLNLHGGLRAFGATFLVFADYMRPPLRLSALMSLSSIFVFTHDSIFVGEDGPTHQPIEQAEALRAIPRLLVLRPGDAQETFQAWKLALKQSHRPCSLLLTRQNLKVYEKPANWKEDFEKGGYVVKDTEKPETVILATGSEVNLALEAVKLTNRRVRVVSVSSRELLQDNPNHLAKLVPQGAKVVAAEAGITTGWKGLADNVLGLDRFGESGPGAAVAAHLGLTAENLAKLC